MPAFRHPVVELIRKRVSWRSFVHEPISAEKRDAYLAALERVPVGPYGNKVRLRLIENVDLGPKSVKKLGTYGVIKGATQFVAGAIGRAQRNMEDFGYSFEWAVLAATDLGLGTCWLGASFKRTVFEETLEVQADEIVPAVSPIGVPLEKRSIVDTVLRSAAGSKNRKSWSELFFLENFGEPLPEQIAGPYATALEMVRLAPSASNRQPWRIIFDPKASQFHFVLERTSGYRHLTKFDLQRIDMGIAMCHFKISVRELGMRGEWEKDERSLVRLPARTEHIITWNC
ncbi:MAG: nitroreductase family protein [Pseudomonadota bacterium]